MWKISRNGDYMTPINLLYMLWRTVQKKNFDKKVMLDITAVNPRWPPVVIMQKCLFISHHAGADPGGGGGHTRHAPPPPPKIGKNMIFLHKIVIFHTKYPKNFRASLAQFF